MNYSNKRPIQELQADKVIGKITEIYGSPDTGKTNLALSFAVFFQQQNLNNVIYYVDADCKLTTKHLQKYPNLDIERIFLQKTFGSLPQVIRSSKMADVIIVDSIPMTLTKRELHHMLSRLKAQGKTVITINQIRDNFFDEKGPLRPFYDDISRKVYDIRIDMDTQTFEEAVYIKMPIFDILNKLKKEESF